MSARLEHLFVVGRESRFQQEHLDKGTRLLTEMQTRLNHLRIVENHESALWQMTGQIIEDVLSHLTVLIEQQFRVVALCQWEFCNALIRQRIIVIAYMNMFCIH